MNLPNKKYSIIYADPPWAYPESGSKAKVHDKHYPCMPLDDICELPVADIAADNCALFIWVTAPRLFDSLAVINAWGFEYKTIAFNWVKKNKNNDNYFLGCGSYTRSNSELCLLAVKGKMYGLKQSFSVRQVCDAKIRKHSQKPDEIRDSITELFGELPSVELFARQRFDGWDAWGNEIEREV